MFKLLDVNINEIKKLWKKRRSDNEKKTQVSGDKISEEKTQTGVQLGVS